MRLVDTCVVIDLQMPESRWFAWSRATVRPGLTGGPVAVNHIILAEVLSSRQVDRARALLAAYEFRIEPLSDEIAARAGAAQRQYRECGGSRGAIIADFLIGAHASVRGWPLITRDRKRFAGYFPELELIAPEDPE